MFKTSKSFLRIKRVYEQYDKGDGFRILVDRLWPRGLSKKEAHIDLWLKDIAPSSELREWFGHDPKKWKEFKARYKEELDKNKELVGQIRQIAQKESVVTLVYAAKDELHNDAVVLCDYLK